MLPTMKRARRPVNGWLCGVLVASAACGEDGGRSSASDGATAAGSTGTGGAATGTSGAASDSEDAGTAPTGGVTDSQGQTSSGSTANPTDASTDAGSSTAAAASTGAAENQPPVWESVPGTEVLLEEVYVSNFEPGQIFLCSSRTDQVRVLDGNSLKFLQAFTHPAFSEVPNDLYTYGPNGAAFNERGNLVVAAYTQFVEFSDYGVEYKTYPKVAPEATENVIFDARGNLYTTTATGGTDKLNQYRAEDYAFEQTITLPPGAGQLTGITFDGYGRLYVASQTDNLIHVSDLNFEFVEFTWVKTLPGDGNVKGFEGLQFNANGELVAAAGDLVRYNVMAGTKIGTFDAPADEFPVPLRVDNEGNIYTSDYENGGGTVSADIFKFSPEGLLLVNENDAGLLGPFGLAISGTVLAGDPPVAWTYMLAASDPDGDPLTYELVSGPPDMFLDPNTLTLTWYVTSEDIGEHPIVLEVDDGKGGVTVQMFDLVVSA
jgi:streptogramin lyase